jgi:hypothetical protein
MAIADGKYKMDTKNLDNYMPKGAAYQEKLRNLAADLIHKSQNEKKQLKFSVKSKSVLIEGTRKNFAAHEDKRNLVRIRLKQRAKDAQKLVNKAMELGQVEKVRNLQEMNIKVFSILNIPFDEIPKAKSYPAKA